jgi:hypothetical protein
MEPPTGSWLGNMVYNMLGLGDKAKLPPEPDKKVPPPRPLVRLLVGFVLCAIGPVILWVFWQFFQLDLIGFLK